MIEVCAQQGWSVERKITKEHAKKSQNVFRNVLTKKYTKRRQGYPGVPG